MFALNLIATAFTALYLVGPFFFAWLFWKVCR